MIQQHSDWGLNAGLPAWKSSMLTTALLTHLYLSTIGALHLTIRVLYLTVGAPILTVRVQALI